MRNLKRVLSLAIAAVMLMGMMVMGASAVDVGSFKDADEIVNTEAATVVAGLGIFKGEADSGNFNPKGEVTRAEMAAILVKMRNGADYNADMYKGLSRFSDTASYQEGWAEGYINVCNIAGYVSGYAGTSKFGPGDKIQTAQGALMLMKVLGWFSKDSTLNEYGDSWELAAMAKAAEFGILDGVNRRYDDNLTRDDVAQMVYNALTAQMVEFNIDSSRYVKVNNRNEHVVKGTKDPTNTLLYKTFETYVAEGTVVANGITDEVLAGKDGDAGYTTVEFDETIDLDHDGKLDYSEYDFACDTGLDLIGHKVDVYYRMNRANPEVFVVVDKATLVEVIRYDKDSTTRLASAANALGFRRNTILNIDFDNYKVNYDLDVTAKAAGYTKTAANNKYIIVISNSGNYQVDEIILLDQELDQVRSISRTGEYDLYLKSSTKKTVATADFAVKDYVIWTSIGKGGRTSAEARYVIEPATVINGNITKLTGVTTKRTLITASGVDYKESPVSYTDTTLENVIDYQTVRDLGDTTLILDKFDNLVAVAGEPSMKNYVYVAQFGSQHDNSSGKLDTTFGLTADVYLSDGTHKVVFVNYANSSFKNVSWTVTTGDAADGGLAAGDYGINGTDLASGAAARLLNGKINETGGSVRTITNNDMNHYTWTKGANEDADGTFNFKLGALGIYEAEWKDDTHVKLTAIKGEETGDGDNRDTNTGDSAFKQDDRFVTGHSTVVKGSGVAAGNVMSIVGPTKALRQTNGTVYFFVQGVYGSGFSVEVVNDVENIKSFKVDGTGTTKDANTAAARAAAKPYVVQMFSEKVASVDNFRTVSAALIANLGEEAKTDVYYYNRGNYTVQYNSDRSKVLLTYLAWDKDGSEVELTFEKNSSKDAVENNADLVPTGYYTEGSDDLVAYAVLGNSKGNNYATTDTVSVADGWEFVDQGDANTAVTGADMYAYRDGDTVYVVNATLKYETYLNGDTNFFDNVTGVASLVKSAKIVDACNSGLVSVVDIKNAFETDSECHITISYSYGKNSLKTGVLYITSYTPASSTGTGTKPIQNGVAAGKNTTVGMELASTSTVDTIKYLPDGAYMFKQNDTAEQTIAKKLVFGGSPADDTNPYTGALKLADVMFFRFSNTDTGEATLTIYGPNGLPVFVNKAAGVTAGPHFFYTQITRQASGAFFGPGGNATDYPVSWSTTAPAAGTYTWTITGPKTTTVEGSFTIG